MKTTTSKVQMKFKKANYYRNFVWIVIAIFVIGNTIFGWHYEAQSIMEHVFDNIVGALFIISFLGYIMAEAVQYTLGKVVLEIEQRHHETCSMCDQGAHHHCTHMHTFPSHPHGGGHESH